jgi:hypothetical protein
MRQHWMVGHCRHGRFDVERGEFCGYMGIENRREILFGLRSGIHGSPRSGKRTSRSGQNRLGIKGSACHVDAFEAASFMQ